MKEDVVFLHTSTFFSPLSSLFISVRLDVNVDLATDEYYFRGDNSLTVINVVSRLK